MNENLTEKDSRESAQPAGTQSPPKVSVIVPVYKAENSLAGKES